MLSNLWVEIRIIIIIIIIQKFLDVVQGSELPEQHFLIVGGGIAGLTSAYMLLSAGHKVRVQKHLFEY